MKGQIWPISTFFDKLAHSSGTRRDTVLRNSSFDRSFNVLLQACLHISPNVNGLAAIEQKLSKDTTFILPASCFSFQDASNDILFDLKRSC